MREDRLLQALELGPRTQAELGVERPHRIAVGVQRLALAPGAIQGQHQLGTQALPQRLPRHKRLELAHELDPATKREVGLDAVLDRGGPQLLEAGDLGRREGLERHIGQRRAAPLLERRAQPRRRALGSAGRQRPPAVLAEALEAREVELVRLDPQPVAGSAAHKTGGLAAERAAQARDNRLHGLHRPIGRPLPPQALDQTVTRDRLPGAQQQQREQRPLAPAGHRERPTLGAHLDRSEDSKVHRPKVPAPARRRQPLSPHRKSGATARAHPPCSERPERR